MEWFIPGRITNPLNGSHHHWSVRAKWAKAWRTQSGFVAAQHARGIDPKTPKRIIFTGHVVRKFDCDNFMSAMKPVRDGLKDAGIIHDDGPDSGHEFVYNQIIDRKRLGVEVKVQWWIGGVRL